MEDITSNVTPSYDDSSISQLLGAERVRRRPAAVLGSSSLDGARHGFTEIYGNALDEATSGFGDKLDICYYEDGTISVRDYGRGVPLGWNEKLKAWNWHVVYNELYGGGKYEKNQEELKKVVDWNNFNELDYNYLYSVGLNGLGAAATQYTSEHFTVRSIRDGVCTEMNFRKGLPIIDGEPVDVFRRMYDMEKLAPITYPTNEPNGTFIKWKPDADVFSDVNVGGDWLYEKCKDIAHVAHIKLHFKDEQSGRDEIIEAGNLSTLIASNGKKKIVKNNEDEPAILSGNGFSHGTMRVENNPEYIWVCKLNYAIAFTTGKVASKCYHNSVYMSGGVQYGGIYLAVRDFFLTIGRSKGIKFDSRDYEGFITVAVATYSNYASFRGQTKDEVDNGFIETLVYDTVLKRLQLEYSKGNKELTTIIDNAVAEAEARIAIQEYANQVKQAKKTMKVSKDPDKFKTCKAYRAKDYEKAELWIAEGDSACGALVQARDSEFQAVFPIRGKFLNVLKAPLTRVLKNAVIKDIMSLVGTGMDIGDDLFDISKCRFGKIIFATDADVDGFQIRVLLFCLFYQLAPELLTSGKVFIAETPRFEIILWDDKKLYARDDATRDKILAENTGRVKQVNRFKGLGEVNADVLAETTVDPATRTLIPVTLDLQDESTREIIDALFGADKNNQRKNILLSVLGKDVEDLLDETASAFREIENMDFEEETEVVTVGK